jgi:hypothetical protein
MLADQAQEEFAEAIGRSHIIGMIPAGHFRGGQLVGLEDLGRDWPPDDPCIADTAILEGELRDFVPDADNKLVLARIAADQLATVLGHGIFSGKASRFLHFVGCRIYLTSDLRLVIGLPCQQSPWLWIATTSRVVNPQQREKSYAPLDSICEEQPLSSRVAIPDLAVQYFKRHSLMIRQPIAIPAPSVEKGVYSYIRSLGKSQGSRVLGGATLQWGD